MKEGKHPKYQQVLFEDTSNGYSFVCGSTLHPKEKKEFEGKLYPLYKMPISSASHPFFTGSDRAVDSEGRLKKFANRYAKMQAPVQQKVEQTIPTKVGKGKSEKKGK